MALAQRLLSRERTKTFVAIDIGSSTALRSILFDSTDRDRVAIDRHALELPERESPADFIRLADENIRRIIFHYLRRTGRVPEAVLIGIGSHLSANEAGVAAAERDRPASPITARELDAILVGYARHNRSKTVGGAPYALAGLVPFGLAVDGYRVDTLTRDTIGRSIEISFLAAYTHETYWRALKHLRTRWGGMAVRFIPNRAALASAVISLLSETEALLIKVGTHDTEVTLIGGGTIRFTGEFSRGGAAASRAIAARLNVADADAERIKRQFDATNLPERTSRIVGDALAENAEAWLNDLVLLLTREERFLLPGKIYLLGGGARMGALSAALANTPRLRELTLAERVSVEILGAERFSALGFRNASPPLVGPEYAVLASLVGHLTGQASVPGFFPAEAVQHLTPEDD